MYNILLVEDDKNIREMLVEYFSKRDKEKFNITLAENGLKGLDKAYENSYDLLLLDVMLPEMDGFTLCKEIRRYSDVPIMFITARTSEADMLNGYALGCDDYIVKPIALPVFYEKVKSPHQAFKRTCTAQFAYGGECFAQSEQRCCCVRR